MCVSKFLKSLFLFFGSTQCKICSSEKNVCWLGKDHKLSSNIFVLRNGLLKRNSSHSSYTNHKLLSIYAWKKLHSRAKACSLIWENKEKVRTTLATEELDLDVLCEQSSEIIQNIRRFIKIGSWENLKAIYLLFKKFFQIKLWKWIRKVQNIF